MKISRDKLIVHSNSFFKDGGKFFWGKANYSYKVVADRFSEFFKRNKINEIQINDPRIFHHDVSRKEFKNFVHFTCTAYEDLRPMPNAYNIASVAWEFDTFPKNKLKNLELYDEIWATSNLGRNAIKKHIINKNIKVKTVPIPLSDTLLKNNQPRLSNKPFSKLKYYEYPKGQEDSKNEKLSISKLISGDYVDPKSFKDGNYIFSLFNPWDRRKDFSNLIKLFLDKRNTVNETLLIKLSIDNKGTRLNNIPEILEAQGYKDFTKDYQKSNKKIVFCYGFLTEKELYQIFRQAKFILYISKCEGTNLPLVESLYLNCPVLTTIHTGINDYLPKNYSHKIDSQKDFLDEFSLRAYGFDNERKLPHWNIVDKTSFFETLNSFKENHQLNINPLVKHFSDIEILRRIYDK